MTRRSFYIYFSFPLAVLILYVLPSLLTTLAFSDGTAFTLLTLSLVSLVLVVASSLGVRSALSQYQADFSGRRIAFIAKSIIVIFLMSYIVLAIDFGGFPVTKFFMDGGNPAILRAEFSKEKAGLANIALYLRSITLKGLLALSFLVLLDLGLSRWVRFTFIAFSIVSVLTYEKAIAIWVGMPLVLYLYFNGNRRGMLKAALWMTSMIVISSILQFGSDLVVRHETPSDRNLSYAQVGTFTVTPGIFSEASTASKAAISSVPHLGEKNLYAEIVPASLRDQQNYQFILVPTLPSSGGYSNIFWRLANRTFWIPFVTAYDSLIFWNIKHDEELLLFSVNRHLSRLTGSEFSDIERELFRFQFGGGYDSTGNANFAYFVEGYVAFGMLGLLIYSAVIGGVIGVSAGTKNAAVIAASFCPVFSFLNASLISSFFSGGVAFFIVMLWLGPRWRRIWR